MVYDQPKSAAERRKIAVACRDCLDIKMPVLIDDMDNKANAAYAAWPARIYVVGRDGCIAYVGRPGPKGFRPAEVNRFLEGYLAKEAPGGPEVEAVAEQAVPREEKSEDVGPPPARPQRSPLDKRPEDPEAAEASEAPAETATVDPSPEPKEGPTATASSREGQPADGERPATPAWRHLLTGLAFFLVAGAALACYRPRRRSKT